MRRDVKKRNEFSWFRLWIQESDSVRRLSQLSGHSAFKIKQIKNYWLHQIPKPNTNLSNIHYILDKIEHDGFLKTIRESFEKVLNHEILFAVTQLSKMEKKSEKVFDMKNQLTNNTYIFKENLKLITGFTSKIRSRPGLEGYSKVRYSRSNDL